MKSSIRTFRFSRLKTIGLVASAIFSLGATQLWADDDPGHPRVNEVNQRLDNQQERIQHGEADGQINHKEAKKDEKTDAKIAQQERSDRAKDGGHLTKQDQRNLNQEENKNSERISDQRQH